MLKEVTKKEAVMAALEEKDTFLIYKAIDGYRVENLRLSLAHILQPDNARFVTDVPDEQFSIATASPHKNGKGTHSRKKTDVGKIKALYEAGWAQSKIADEMGISKPTVNKYVQLIKGEKDKGNDSK